MWLHEQLEIADKEREAEFLKSIGPLGRILDNPASYLLLLICLSLTALAVGFVIGVGL